MTEHALDKLLALLRAGKALTETPGAERENAFHAALDSLVADERARRVPALEAALTGHDAALRSADAPRRLGPDSALGAEVRSQDGTRLSITINGESAPEGLLLTVAIEAEARQADWAGATVTVFREQIAHDFAATSPEGECRLGPFSAGPVDIEILSTAGYRIRLPNIELLT